MKQMILLKNFLNLQIMRRGTDFIFGSVELLNYHLHQISLKRGRSYLESPERLRNKRGTINPQNNDDKCFQYAIIVALNYQNIENHVERISNIKPFINQYNWEGIEFPTKSRLEKV